MNWIVIYLRLPPLRLISKGRWFPQPIQENYSLSDLQNFSCDSSPLILPTYPSTEIQTLCDVVFPVVHGQFVEDGLLQGILESMAVPYVGPNVLGSAVAMDKDISSRLVRDAGFNTPKFICVNSASAFADIKQQALAELAFPVFVKPANTGSSVGVSKVNTPDNLFAALAEAFQFDTRVVIEEGIVGREIEIAILENPIFGERPLASLPGEIILRDDFYSYRAKYLDEKGAELSIPAQLPQEKISELQLIAAEIFNVLACEGMGRLDFFLEEQTQQWYFNELNTLPGFTSISMYPKLWSISGISYKSLLTKLIYLARDRFERRAKLLTNYPASVTTERNITASEKV